MDVSLKIYIFKIANGVTKITERQPWSLPFPTGTKKFKLFTEKHSRE